MRLFPLHLNDESYTLFLLRRRGTLCRVWLKTPATMGAGLVGGDLSGTTMGGKAGVQRLPEAQRN